MSIKLSKKQLKDLHLRFSDETRRIRNATIDSIVEESHDCKMERIQRLLLPDNYGEFFSYYFGAGSDIPMADCACAWYHTAIYKEIYDNAFITVFNLIFRGGAKSTHANMGYPLALKQSGKAQFFLVVGANAERAAMLLQDLQLQFLENKRLIADFGVQKVHGSWADGIFETSDRCTFMALGIDQPFRGLRQNGVRLEYVSLDDIEDAKRAMNTSLTNEYIAKVTADIQGAFSTRSERTIVNNNYFIKKGFVYGLATKKGFDLSKIDTKQNTILRSKYASLFIVNLTTQYFDTMSKTAWQPSWPERFSRQDCLRKIEQYEHDVEVLSGEFYNTPINSGKRIKADWIRMVNPIAYAEYLIIAGNWDLAYGTAACYKGFALIGIKDMTITVLDIFCRQSSIDVAMDWHYSLAKRVAKEGGNAMYFYDGAVAQECVYEPQWLRAARKAKTFHIPQAQKSMSDKFTKIDTTLTSVLPDGILCFSSHLDNNPDWEEAKRQLLNFEKGSGYPIDFPDALSDAIIQAQDYLYDAAEEDGNESLMNKPLFGKKSRGGY